MSVWLERGETRYLDIITTCVQGLVKESAKGKYPTKYELFISGSDSNLFTNINPILIKSMIRNFAAISQGRYIRALAYVLLALDFADDLFYKKISNISIDSLETIDENEFIPFVQSNKSRYTPTRNAIKFSKALFASREWQEMLQERVLSYGYFCRYLDVVEGIQLAYKQYLDKTEIPLSSLKNIIGPFDSRVKGSGPDFIQETFKTWAFMLDIIDIKTKGRLTNYDLNKKLEYLKEHTGYITDGTKAYLILRNLRKAQFTRKKEMPHKIRTVSFMRLVNLELWRREFEKAISTSLRRLRLLYVLSKLKGNISIGDFIKDEKLKEIMRHFENVNESTDLLDDLLFLESTGIRLETKSGSKYFFSLTNFILDKIIEIRGNDFFEELKTVNTKSTFYENAIPIYPDIDINKVLIRPVRTFDIENFEKYLPSGKMIKWMKKN